MEPTDTELLESGVEALYLSLGLLVRHLHVSGAIEADHLINEIRLTGNKKDIGSPAGRRTADALIQIADSFARDLPAWNESREVEALYRPGMGR